MVEAFWLYLTSFDNVGPLLVWFHIIGVAITLYYNITDLWR